MAWNNTLAIWSVLDFCAVGELTVRKWCLGLDENTGLFRITMWLPFPCGEVSLRLSGRDGSYHIRLSSRYRQGSDDALESRVPGMLSHLNTVAGLTPRLPPGVYSAEDSSPVAGLDFFEM